MSNMQKNSMKLQAEHYFEAISEVLNADRDIYQARLAQEKMLDGEGPKEADEEDFRDNAQQVFDRFQLYRQYLEDEPKDLLTPFESFNTLYNEWLTSSERLISTSKGSTQFSEKMISLDNKFLVIRNMLDEAGELLRTHIHNSKDQIGSAEELNNYVEAITEVLNADRDLYQARLAQQKIINHVGSSEENKEEFNINAAQALERFRAYRGHLIDEPELTQPYSKFDVLFDEWFEESLVHLNSPEAQISNKLPQEIINADAKFEAIRSLLDKAGEAVRNHSREIESNNANNIARNQKFAMIVTSIAFVIALLLGYFIPLKITKNVENMGRRIKEIAEGDGDLTQRIDSTSKDELGDLAKEFDGFVEQLRSIISNIHKQSESPLIS
ncbi:HAMP domain-containing protein [Marinomonas foliarum]|nr:HAMP domain-containing protein [Marinomonas foliarum]